MTSDQTQPLIASIVRHGLTLLAGYLVASGAFNPTTSAGFVEGLTGVLVGLIGFGWSLAEAGKLGEQAKTIAVLIDNLASSVPVTSVIITSPSIPEKSANPMVPNKTYLRPSLAPWPATPTGPLDYVLPGSRL